MLTVRAIVIAGAFLGASMLASPTPAQACGGCFAPPGAAQVVTDHRMVLSLSTQQTTLWDQFQYTGRPEDFSWILPIRYTESTRVQLASDDFLTLMTNVSVPALRTPPPPPWPPWCVAPARPGGAFDASASFADAPSPPPSDTGVTVLREEVVGPYAVAIVRGRTGMGLRDWLRMNGYAVPTAIEPTIDHYLGLNMDFIALRLRPGKGLNRMVPVRVTLDGYQPRLPLRMIAAGVADRVGLALMVVAQSRVEAMNFPNGELADSDFVYDWNNRPGDLGRVFLDQFNARNRMNGERLWLTESSQRMDRFTLENQARFFPQRTGFGPDAGVMSASSAVEDVGVAFAGIGAQAMVTRLRADLPARMLDRDLDLAASDRGTRDRLYQFGRELNRPMYADCPWSPPDGSTGIVDRPAPPTVADASAGTLDGGTAPGADAEPPTPATAEGGVRCATTPGAPGGSFGALLAGVALALRAVRRRARSSAPA